MTTATWKAHVALTRFGLGAKRGGIQRIANRTRAALASELDDPGIAGIMDPSLPSYVDACKVMHTTAIAEQELYKRELLARLNKHLEPEIGFVERLVLFFS